jgi:tRNA A37 threonylcarbamoyltransferase TsaD/tRNA A37 threonylcarbamoyladenosine biosynthesis protein TsaE
MSLVLPLSELRETERLGAALAAVAQRGDVIFLHGDLGAGKTALARGFLRHYFHNSGLDVPSPSYLLHFTYTDEGEEATVAADGGAAESLSAEDTVAGATHGRDFRGGRFAALPGVAVHHLDPYRLPEGRIAGLVEFEKMFVSDISLIEWPERLGDQLVTATSPPRLELTLGAEGGHIQAGERIASLRAVGPRWEALIAEWRGLGPPGTLPSVPALPAAASTAEGGSGSGGGGASQITPLNPSPAQPGVAEGAASSSPSARRLPTDPSEWRVLGIESSCDDTGAAVITGTGEVLGEALASQEKVHEQWGGVVPKLAQQAHREAIDGTVEEALRRAGMVPPPAAAAAAAAATAAGQEKEREEGGGGGGDGCQGLTAIAVTVGPGLGPCLQVGVKKAYELAARYSIPIVRVHHMEAHAMVTRLPQQQQQQQQLLQQEGGAAAGGAIPRPQLKLESLTPGFPFMTVLVSGGHNMSLLTTGIGKHTILGSTLDDSIGEAFDKTARLLGITHIPGNNITHKTHTQTQTQTQNANTNTTITRTHTHTHTRAPQRCCCCCCCNH